MKVDRTESGHVLMEFDVNEGEKLAHLIREHARHITNGCLELASLLSEASYNANNHFRQPEHAFDEQAPRPPSIEET